MQNTASRLIEFSKAYPATLAVALTLAAWCTPASATPRHAPVQTTQAVPGEPDRPPRRSRARKKPPAMIVVPAPPLGPPVARSADAAAGPARAAKPRARPRRASRAKLNAALNAVGQELVAITGESPEGVFLYVEIGDGWVTPSVFKVDGEVIRYVESEESGLELLILKAWLAEPASKRWSVMEYDLKNGAFSVAFQYPDEVDVEAMHPEYRENALRTRFGNRPLVFPRAGQADSS